MKNIKRVAVFVTVLAFVATAVYLNWSYDQRTAEAAKLGEGKTGETAAETGETAVEEEDAGLFYTTLTDSEESEAEPESAETGLTKSQQEQFAAIRLARETSRAEAAGALEVIAASEGVGEEEFTQAVIKLTLLADRTAKEGELESEILSRGFLDCVVCCADDSITVSVACEGGLTSVAVAKITDVIVTGTAYTAAELRVTEIR